MIPIVRLIIFGFIIFSGLTGTLGKGTGFICLRDLGTSFIFPGLTSAGTGSSAFFVSGIVSETVFIFPIPGRLRKPLMLMLPSLAWPVNGPIMNSGKMKMSRSGKILAIYKSNRFLSYGTKTCYRFELLNTKSCTCFYVGLYAGMGVYPFYFTAYFIHTAFGSGSYCITCFNDGSGFFVCCGGTLSF